MAGKQKNMFDGYGVAAQQRKEQQEKIEAAVMGKPTPAAASRKRGEDATTITLAISREDKVLLKSWAAAHGTTMSEMLHGWIVQTCIEN